MATTFAVTDTALSDALNRALGNANHVYIENEALAPASGNLTYTSFAQNWETLPPPIILVDGVRTAPSGISYVSGAVTFGTAQTSTAIVTASFTFTPYASGDITAIITDSLYAIEGRLGTGFDETAFPRNIKEPVVTLAYIMAMRGLMSESAEYYRWTIEGRTIDKNGVTAHYDRIIQQQMKYLEEVLIWLRPQYLAEGKTVYLNLDMGRPPSQYSRYRPPGFW